MEDCKGILWSFWCFDKVDKSTCWPSQAWGDDSSEEVQTLNRTLGRRFIMFISKTNMFMFPIIGWLCISRVSFLYSMYGQQEPVGMTIASTYNLLVDSCSFRKFQKVSVRKHCQFRQLEVISFLQIIWAATQSLVRRLDRRPGPSWDGTNQVIMASLRELRGDVGMAASWPHACPQF
jgi:hypothetical protein